MSKKAEFVEIEVCRDGTMLPVRMYQSNGAIAITPFITYDGKSHRTYRTVTHLPTGCAIESYLTRAEAKRVYDEAVKACDWSKVTVRNAKRRVPRTFRDWVKSGAYRSVK